MSGHASQTVARQWQIVRLLSESSAYWSSAMVLEHLQTLGFEADVRTIQRDLKNLQQIFPLECNDSDRPYSWRWRQLPNANCHWLTLEQAMCLQLIKTQLKDHIPPDILSQLAPLFERSQMVLAARGKIDGFAVSKMSSPKYFWQLFGTTPTNKLAKELKKIKLLELSHIVESIRDF